MAVRVFPSGSAVRARPDIPDASWDDARRDLYLLRRDVARPLSADRSVWPALDGIGRTSFDFPFWVPLDEVRAQRDAWAGGARDEWVVVVFGVAVEHDADAALVGGCVSLDAELRVEPAWAFLGYDVTDSPTGGISGLCNCGYSDEPEASLLRARWGPLLNEQGLFGRVEDAFGFRVVCDRRVEEHAPFFVTGLWIAT